MTPGTPKAPLARFWRGIGIQTADLVVLGAVLAYFAPIWGLKDPSQAVLPLIACGYLGLKMGYLVLGMLGYASMRISVKQRLRAQREGK